MLGGEACVPSVAPWSFDKNGNVSLVQRPSCVAERLRGGKKSSAGNGGDRLVVAELVSVGLSLKEQCATIPDVKHADLRQSECTLTGGNLLQRLRLCE